MGNGDMRICFFQIVPHHGGASRSCVETCRRLARRADVLVIDPYGCAKPYVSALEEAQVPHRVLQRRISSCDIGGWKNRLGRAVALLRNYPHLRALARMLDREIEAFGPDVICTDNLKSAYILSLVPQIHRVPVCYYLRGWFRPCQVGYIGGWLCRRHASGIIAVSYATQAALSCSGVSFDKIYVLHNPVEAESLVEQSHRPLALPLPGMDKKIRLLVPGSITHAKGQHTAVQALSRLRSLGHDAVLWIAGDHQPIGPDRSYVTDLRGLIRRLDLQDHVYFIGLRDDLPQVIHAASHVVLPSHSEGHPRVVLETMVLRRPVFTTPAGGCMDMVIPGLTGYLFGFERPDELAGAIHGAIRAPQDERSLVETAYNWVMRAFAPHDHTEKLMMILEDIIRRSRKQPTGEVSGTGTMLSCNE